MATFTDFAELASIMSGLTPHIEERALTYALYKGVMPARVQLMTDMSGWNIRKVSDYVRPNRAQLLSEATAIPDSTPIRKRLAEIDPDEWGDSYPISNRRYTTDLEPILTDVVRFMGDSLAMRREKIMMKKMLALATTANTFDYSTVVYDVSQQIPAQVEFEKLGLVEDGQLYHVIHSYQQIPVRQALIDLSKAAVPLFRNTWVANWTVGGFGNLNVASTPTLPRAMVYKLAITGSSPAGTFKLRAGELASGAQAVTANITISTTPATMVSNINAALDALGIGDWTVAGAAIDAITITAPTGFYVDAEDELRLPTSESTGLPDTSGMTNYGTDTILTINEKVGATVLAPMFFRSALAWDVREAIKFSSWYEPKERVVQTIAHETYGVEGWRTDRVLFIKTKAESPRAVS